MRLLGRLINTPYRGPALVFKRGMLERVFLVLASTIVTLREGTKSTGADAAETALFYDTSFAEFNSSAALANAAEA